MAIRIGFAYDRPLDTAETSRIDYAAEYEDLASIDWLREQLAAFGDVVDLPWSREFAYELSRARVDIVFNITEAAQTRNRESLVPAIAESLGVAYTGTDAVGLGISLDKTITKVIAADLGIPVPTGILIDAENDSKDATANALAALEYPVIVKPNSGGSSYGIDARSRVETVDRAKELVAEFPAKDRLLVEEFVAGREFAVALLERDGELFVLPIVEIELDDRNPVAFYSGELKKTHAKKLVFPNDLKPTERGLLEGWSIDLFRRIGCRDLARLDFRRTDSGEWRFLEINPLPGLSPFYGIFPAQAEAAGLGSRVIVETLIKNGLARSQEG